MADYLLDPLCCFEQHWEADEDCNGLLPPKNPEQEPPTPPSAAAEEEEWAEQLSFLAGKERETHPDLPPKEGGGDGDLYLGSARRGMVEWAARAAALHGFNALTAVLAVSYLDRCFLAADGGARLRLQADRPWMGRLSAVACLSLAAKVEETHVPVLLDLQLAAAEDENAGYVFEPKTIRRMEQLVLSSLNWRMNPVTPLSFIHHILPQVLNLTSSAAAAGQLLRRCQAILLSAIADRRWVRHPPSVLAGAAMMHALGMPLDPESGGITAAKYGEAHHPLVLLNLTKESVVDCYQLILESIDGNGGFDISVGSKRKRQFYQHHHHPSFPSSPNGVIGLCFSCDSSSNDDGDPRPASASSSPGTRPFKRADCFIAGCFDEDWE